MGKVPLIVWPAGVHEQSNQIAKTCVNKVPPSLKHAIFPVSATASPVNDDAAWPIGFR